MTRRQEEVKARLMAKAEAVIEELLSSKPEASTISLAEIEQAVRVAGQEIEQALTDELLQESTRQVAEEWPRCAECGARMQAKGKRAKRVVTETGEVRLEREYYYCAGCRRGIFPPG